MRTKPLATRTQGSSGSFEFSKFSSCGQIRWVLAWIWLFSLFITATSPKKGTCHWTEQSPRDLLQPSNQTFPERLCAPSSSSNLLQSSKAPITSCLCYKCINMWMQRLLSSALCNTPVIVLSSTYKRCSITCWNWSEKLQYPGLGTAM